MSSAQDVSPRDDRGMERYEVDPANTLRVRWRPDDEEDLGQLVVSASSGGFSGQTAMWFNEARVREWAQSLTAYPPADEPVRLSSGYGTGDDEWEVIGLAVQ